MHWFKDPCEDLRPAAILRKSGTVMQDISMRGTMSVHTHPQFRRPSLPSFQDISSLINLDSRAQAIGAITPEGKVAGYTLVAKPADFAKNKWNAILFIMSCDERWICEKEEANIRRIMGEIKKLEKLPKNNENRMKIAALNTEWDKSGTAYLEALQSAMKKLHMQIKMYPMKEFEFKDGYFVKKPSPRPSATPPVSVLIADNREKIAVKNITFQTNVPPADKNKEDEERKRRNKADEEKRKKQILIQQQIRIIRR